MNMMKDAMEFRNKDGSRNWTEEIPKALLRLRHRGLKKVEAQLVAHQQGQIWYKQKIKFMKIDLDDKTDVLTYHKKLLAEAQKEKEDLKAKVEKWHNSSKNLSKLLNTQMSANDKFGLGYGDHRYDGILSYENEVLQSVFMNKESEIENQPLYDRFVTAEGMHAVPPPMTGNYMPSGPDVEVDDSKFTYGPKQTQPSESESQSSEFDTCESNISAEPSELVSEPVVNESNVECQPKVWSDAPIIEEYESDSEDECVSIPTKQQETPSFANQQVKTPRENVKSQFTHSQKPKVDKKDLGYGFAVRACFVCGSLNHLIRDCDFHEKRMARKAELNNGWNNVQRVNKQNQFVPSAVLTRTGKIPVSTARASSTKNFSTARQSFNRQTVLTNTAMKVNTVKPIVNRVRPANVFHKTHSPSSRPFKKTTVLRTKFSNQKLNTAKVNAVSTVGEKGKLLLSPQQVVIGDHKDTIDYPHRDLKNKGIVDSGYFRHMTGNKAYLAEFQDFNGGPVAFGGSKGYITGKGKIKTGKLDFEDVCFVKELQHFNLFSVSQMCDKKNKVLFTDSECLVLSPEFKLPDENQVLLKIPRQNNMYSFNLENIVPSGGLACLIAKATTDESNKWHRRLGHVNFKNLNKLVKGNLVRGLPSKIFQNDHTCVAWGGGGLLGKESKPKALLSENQSYIHAVKMKLTKMSINIMMIKKEAPREEKQVLWMTERLLRSKKRKLMRMASSMGRSLETLVIKKELLSLAVLVDLPYGKKAIGTKWVYQNKKDERGVVLRNKARFGYRRGTLIKLSLKKDKNDIILVQEILKKFDFANVKTASTPIKTQKPLVKDEEANDVDVHLYRFQVTPKTSRLSAVKRIFRYLKGKPKLGLWYPRVSSFDLESYSDSDYAGANLDRKSINRRKQSYVAAADACGQYYHSNQSTLLLGTPFHRDAYGKKSLGAENPHRGLIEVRELLSRVTNGTEALLIPTLFILWWTKLVPPVQTLISLFTTISLPSTMVVLDLCLKHNMVAYLEKSEGNAEFHEIIDFLKRMNMFRSSKEIRRLKAQSQAQEAAKLTDKEGVSTDIEKVSTDRPIVSTDGSKVSTDEHIEGTDAQVEGTEENIEGTEEHIEGTEEQVESTDGHKKGTEEEIAAQATQTSTQTPTSTIFGDDETIAKVLLNMSQAKAVSREKEKGVELKDVEETDRPKPTSTRSLLTLKPLPKIDPKDKGKKKIEEEDESESESDGIPQAEKKFKQLESDEELARKMQEEWEEEEERNRVAEEQAANEALIRNFDDIKARIEADRLLAEKLQEQEREQFTIEERAKFLHDTIAAQRKFLAQQRSEAIRNKPPTKNQLRNQMMTYLKHVGNFKHAELKIKKFEEVQALYEKIKRSDEDFISIGSAEDERLIKKMNEKGVDSSKSKEEVQEKSKEEVKEESKEEESTKKRKLGIRKKMKSRKRRYIQNTSEDDSDKENDELRLHLIIAPDEEKEVDYEILDRKYPIKEWKTECLGTKPQTDQAEHLEEINLNVVIRSNGQKRYFSTLMSVLSIFDREDLNAVYQLVMDRFQDEMPEGFDRVLWGDLMVLFNPDDKDEFWNSQLDWKIVSWKLHSSSGVHTLVTKEGVVIHMLVEKKYPLRKEVLMQMLKLKLESEEDSTMALELIKFVKKILAELEPEE
ncbi:ribonuclease H-like domain-containing protein [Tanacetum coccineum]|uniref:Ribonuclease H-like domain-containing protein n=1 Tax=Tanacetum coccineum TaxID=301880 RepID=A0ABQ4WGV1_9ASTR